MNVFAMGHEHNGVHKLANSNTTVIHGSDKSTPNLFHQHGIGHRGLVPG